MERESKLLDWLEREKNRDSFELEREKKELIDNLKKLKKEDILPPKPTKKPIWKKILKFITS